MIIAENLYKSYGGKDVAVHALRGLDLFIDSGEFVAVMGPSGSGKSTLLSILGGLNTPDRGRLEVGELDVYALSSDQRADFRREFLGFVFQNFYLVPYLTLLENVMLPLTTKRIVKKEKRDLALEALRRVGLEDKIGRLPGQASGGEQERAAVARAIVNRPPVLLADEPTGNLDGNSGREVMKLLGELQSEGMTIVMVTHNEAFASYAGRILHMADGGWTDRAISLPAAA